VTTAALWSDAPPVPTAAMVLIAGVALGAVYVLSPFSVLFVVLMAVLIRWAGSGLPEGERRWLYAILITAVAARVLVILGLFLITNHHQVPFGHLFGDEEYFIRRSLWIRNLALGLPLHRADFIYAYDDYSRTSFLYVLAVLQMLVGPAPYGAHLFNILCYVAASVVLYRLIRPAFGPLPALLGLVLLLFLPTQFAWSISALKDPLFLLVMSVGLSAAVTVGRPGHPLKRIGALLILVGSAYAAQSIREGGMAMAGAGAAGGLFLGLVARRPRVALALIVACLLAMPIVVTRGAFKDRVVVGVRQVAMVHWGHVNTPGYVYTIFDGGFYLRKASIPEMTFRQGVEYMLGSFVAYVTVPLPWQMHSLAALSYLPEQLMWYLMVLLMPLGLIAAMRRDALVTSILASYMATAVVLVAITSGNIGTLVRHRGLALPYLLWFSVVGACEIIAVLTASQQDSHANRR
jgi:hypothetical protein